MYPQISAEEGAFFNFAERRLKEFAMTKRIRAKYKIDRRLGENIWGRPKSPVNKRE